MFPPTIVAMPAPTARRVVASAAAVALVVAALAFAQRDGSSSGRVGVSTHLMSSDEPLDAQVRAIRDGGVRWIREDFSWERIEPEQGRFDWGRTDELMAAAAAAGVDVTAEKLKITLLSALMTALAGALYCQYQMFISPDTVSGIAVSLQMVFAVIVGGVYVALGPTVGAIITILLAEILRIGFGTKAVGWDNLVYGVLLVVFIIFLPKGILGSVLERLKTQPKKM